MRSGSSHSPLRRRAGPSGLLLLALAFACPAPAGQPVKIVFDTDIGTDVDDAIALVFALRRPEFEVLGVTTSRGEVGQRAAIAARLLREAERTDIPVAPGSPLPLSGKALSDKPVDQSPFAAGELPPAGDAQNLFRKVIRENWGEVWIVVVGPMTNAALLVRDHPDLAKGLKGIVCMGGKPTRPYAETNIRNDPEAARIVLESGLLKFAASDDVSKRLRLTEADLERLRHADTPTTRALLDLVGFWRTQWKADPGAGRRFPVVFDGCPLIWLMRPELFSTESTGLAVDLGSRGLRGVVTRSKNGPPCAVTTDIREAPAHDLLMGTIAGPEMVPIAYAPAPRRVDPEDASWVRPLEAEAGSLGKPEWRPMLRYEAALHVRATHPAEPPFAFPWEEIGTGYKYGPAFGAMDLMHAVIDVLPQAPRHAKEQLLNELRLQFADGCVPGVVWMPGSPQARGWNRAVTKADHTAAAVWVVAADDTVEQTGDRTLLPEFFRRVVAQIGWYERCRRAVPDGFYYTDVRTRVWESGFDEGIRGDHASIDRREALVDATSQVYQLCRYAARWAEEIGADPLPWKRRADRLEAFIRSALWVDSRGFFYDAYGIENPRWRADEIEGLWPLIAGAASPAQATRVIDEWLLNPARFLTVHPVPTVAASDPKFELRMWRGPTWNFLTYWAARACVHYGNRAAARRLLEAALDDTAKQYGRTGTIWEYYHPFGGHPEDLARKPDTVRNMPYSDYAALNPVFAMARLWERCR